MTIKFVKFLVASGVAALALAGCVTVPGGGPTPAATSSADAKPSTEPVATPSPEPTPVCSELTAREAAQKSISEVPPAFESEPYAWDLDSSDVSNYDPCEDLSWIVLSVAGATGSSPYQIMLFHGGEFLAAATKNAYGFWPVVERLGDHQISVTYMWPKDGESNAGATGRSVSTFTWDQQTGAVTRTGSLPPGYPLSEEGVDDQDAESDTDNKALIPVPGAYPGAGGPLPKNATPAQTIRQEQYLEPTAVIQTPSGNIGCDISAQYAGCGVLSFLETAPYGGDVSGSRWWLSLFKDEIPSIEPKGDAPYFAYPDIPAQVLEYGEVVYYLDYVCASQETGLTCWNTVTGHGAVMNRAGYSPF